jgi:L-fuconolactonase
VTLEAQPETTVDAQTETSLEGQAETTVDAHHHFWDPARADYPWMTDELAAIRRAFGPDDLRPLLEATGIARTVLVQTLASLEESAEFLATAQEEPFVAGVVGWVNLRHPGVGDQIAELRAGPGGEKLVGIRHQVHDEQDPEWLKRQDVRRGLSAVESAGLVFDLLVRTRELPAAVETVGARPGQRFVLDHIAKPPISSRRLEPWRARIRRLAELPNVVCKLSGLVTEADWKTWTVDDLRPYFREVVDAFGPKRLMFGSDWPVCLVAADYARVVATTQELVSDLSDEDRARIFGRTAIESYGLADA